MKCLPHEEVTLLVKRGTAGAAAGGKMLWFQERFVMVT